MQGQVQVQVLVWTVGVDMVPVRVEARKVAPALVMDTGKVLGLVRGKENVLVLLR